MTSTPRLNNISQSASWCRVKLLYCNISPIYIRSNGLYGHLPNTYCFLRNSDFDRSQRSIQAVKGTLALLTVQLNFRTGLNIGISSSTDYIVSFITVVVYHELLGHGQENSHSRITKFHISDASNDNALQLLLIDISLANYFSAYPSNK